MQSHLLDSLKLVDTRFTSGYHKVMSILLEGDVEAVREWGRQQVARGVLCHEVLEGTSPAKTRAYAQAALELVHGAVREVTATRAVPATFAVYLSKFLHDAVTATLISPWVAVDDDCRGAVALELAQRCRTMPVLQSHYAQLTPPSRIIRLTPDEHRAQSLPYLLLFLDSLVLEDLAAEPLHDEYLGKVQRLQTGFGMTTDELSKLLHISRAAMHKWTQGGGMSRDVHARIDEWLDVLVRMESYWRPGRLPSIIRRRGRGLKGKTPLEFILAGKPAEVLEYFDVLTDYSGTA